jgi:hypothetical protein
VVCVGRGGRGSYFDISKTIQACRPSAASVPTFDNSQSAKLTAMMKEAAEAHTADLRKDLADLQSENYQLADQELRGLLYECVRRRWLPADFCVRELSGISLRRGGNSAAAAAGVSSIVRASQGRWRCVETPNEHYTSIHHSVMVDLASTLFSNSAAH